jgi:transcription elongation factor GreB
VSRAFTKEDRAEAPLVVPRAPLPAGVTNYVTASGLAALRRELASLEGERARRLTASPEGEQAGEIAAWGERIANLEVRIHSAVLVDPAELAHDEVRFSARVTVTNRRGEQRQYRIVGVDEADAASGQIAFIAPLSRALLGKRIGELVSLRTARGEEEFEIVAIEYLPRE